MSNTLINIRFLWWHWQMLKERPVLEWDTHGDAVRYGKRWSVSSNSYWKEPGRLHLFNWFCVHEFRLR